MMIKINKQDPPEILKNNKEKWTNSLLEAIKNHGSYDQIPSKEKETLLSNYRHNDIQKKLFESSFDKCSFCECKPEQGGNYMEVEHFAPKSIYPQMAFEWDNLLPSCKRCNGDKGTFDTISKPIIDPTKVNPETIFTYDGVRIVAIKGTPQEAIANKTIEVICSLNSRRLYEARADLLVQLNEYVDELEEAMNAIEEADTDMKRKRRIAKLRNSIDKFEFTVKETNCYAGFSRCFIANNPIYTRAKSYLS